MPPRKLLVAYSMASTHVQTTLDYVCAFKQFLDYDVTYLHVTHDAHVTTDFDASGYDVIFHNYCSRFCFDGYVSSTYREALKRFTGLKILAVQDEYDHTDKLKAAITGHGFDIVLTCVPQTSLGYVYPPAEFPGVEFITVFTGYVPDDFASTLAPPMPLRERSITVAYRGRNIGPRYGRLGYEKFEIGRRMKEICDAKGVVNDIAMTEESRIYGKAWFDFIGNSRSMLGSESGSNVFDFDGSINAAYQRLKSKLGRMPSYDEFAPVIAKRDSEISMGQISPRVFECAVMRTPMILFRGYYSDAIEPDTHYIPLELDFSNTEDVLRRLEDIPALETMAGRAYDDLVGSGAFGYRTFVSMLKEHIEVRLTEPRFRGRPERNRGEGTVPVLPADRRLAALAEWPTAQPKGLDDFKKTQIRLSGAHLPREANRLDGYYWRVVQTLQRNVEEFDRLGNWLVSKSSCTQDRRGAGAVPEAKRDFEVCVEVLAERRKDYKGNLELLEQALAETTRKGHVEAERRALDAILEHNQNWLLEYTKLYADVNSQYIACRHIMKTEAAELFAKASNIDKFGYQAHRTRILLKGPKSDLIKACINKIPGARRVAIAVLNRIPRRT